MSGHANSFLSGHLLRLFERGEGCDVYFQPDDGKMVGAHRLILSSVEFFKIMLTSGFVESTTQDPIRIEGISSRELRLAFRFVYTGRLEDVKHKTVFQLLWLSQMWHFVPLRHASVEWAVKHLDTNTAIQTFVDASNVLLSIPPLPSTTKPTNSSPSSNFPSRKSTRSMGFSTYNHTVHNLGGGGGGGSSTGGGGGAGREEGAGSGTLVGAIRSTVSTTPF
ncbi:hypothetical protein AAMO2058_000105300 [Amorphochlora amoebiformis]